VEVRVRPVELRLEMANEGLFAISHCGCGLVACGKVSGYGNPECQEAHHDGKD
jgi:hypothetical protein